MPADAWQLALTTALVPPRERTAEQEAALGLAAPLADELLAADAYVLAVPLYDFGVAQHVKSWIDLLLCDSRRAAVRHSANDRRSWSLRVVGATARVAPAMAGATPPLLPAHSP